MRHLVVIFTLLTLAGCTASAPPATEQQLSECRQAMDKIFEGLEMYAADHEGEYPETLDQLKTESPVLKKPYLTQIPPEPAGASFTYQKKENGFLLGTSGDYTALQAERGFPRMSSQGRFAKTQEELQPPEPAEE